MIAEIASVVGQAAAAPTSAVGVGAEYAILQPLLMAVGTAAAAVATAAAALAAAWLKKKLNLTDAEAEAVGLQIDAQHRAALQASLTNAAGVALNRLGNSLQGKTVDLHSPAVAEAVKMVIGAVPDAVEHYNLTNKPDEIAQKIIGKMSQIAATSGPPPAGA